MTFFLITLPFSVSDFADITCTAKQAAPPLLATRGTLLASSLASFRTTALGVKKCSFHIMLTSYVALLALHWEFMS